LLEVAANPEMAVQYACKKLRFLTTVYENESAVIAAYNAGSPRKRVPGGEYVNQKYVNDVTDRLKRLRAIG
jgi:soluble lytic murein transglycosylase-like protein